MKACQVGHVQAQQRRLHSAQGTQDETVLLAARLFLQSLHTARLQPAASDAERKTGAGGQLLSRNVACLKHDQGAQLTFSSAANGMKQHCSICAGVCKAPGQSLAVSSGLESCCASASCASCPAAQHVRSFNFTGRLIAARCGMLTCGHRHRQVPAAYCEQADLLPNRPHPA